MSKVEDVTKTKHRFSVQLEAKTGLDIKNILPELSSALDQIPNFSDCKLLGLTVFHDAPDTDTPRPLSPLTLSPNDTLTDGAEEFYEIQETEPTTDSSSESRGSDDDPESATPNPELATLWQLAESITSITSSLIPQTEEKCDAQNCENCPDPTPPPAQLELREIDTLVYPETVDISPSEAAALFDQFDQSEPPTKESPQDHTLNDRIFRVAFYDKDPVNPEESEPDEIDIPINASVISTSEKMPEAPPSDDTISSDSDNDKEVEPQSLTRERSLEFEYEPLIANIVAEKPVEEKPEEVDSSIIEISEKKEVNESLILNESSTLNDSSVQLCEIKLAAGDIRERGVDSKESNEEIRARMSLERKSNISNGIRAPIGPPEDQQKTFRNRNRDQNNWDNNSERSTPNRDRYRNENRSGNNFQRDRRHSNQGNRENHFDSGSGYRPRENYRESRDWNNGNQSRNRDWGGTQNDNHGRNRDWGGNHMGENRRRSNWDSDHHSPRKNFRENRHRDNRRASFENNDESGYHNRGNRQPQNFRTRNEYNTGNRSYHNNNNGPNKSFNPGSCNRAFLSDHCNRDDLGTAKQFIDGSFGSPKHQSNMPTVPSAPVNDDDDNW